MTTAPTHRHVLGMRVDAVTPSVAVDRVLTWALEHHPAYVCVANVHMTMEAHDDPSFQKIVNAAPMVVPDGMPLVWALRALGVSDVSRVRGPDLAILVAQAAARHGVPVALYGGSASVVRDAAAFLADKAPGLDVREAISPPFRPLTINERDAHIARLVGSGARILFVGLGCPKQERWMAEHVVSIPVVHIGIGAAFDIYAGRVPQAPAWMQRLGLEWAFRFALEPRRLFGRYVRHNPRFVVKFIRQWLRAVYGR